MWKFADKLVRAVWNFYWRIMKVRDIWLFYRILLFSREKSFWLESLYPFKAGDCLFKIFSTIFRIKKIFFRYIFFYLENQVCQKINHESMKYSNQHTFWWLLALWSQSCPSPACTPGKCSDGVQFLEGVHFQHIPPGWRRCQHHFRECWRPASEGTHGGLGWHGWVHRGLKTILKKKSNESETGSTMVAKVN